MSNCASASTSALTLVTSDAQTASGEVAAEGELKVTIEDIQEAGPSQLLPVSPAESPRITRSQKRKLEESVIQIPESTKTSLPTQEKRIVGAPAPLAESSVYTEILPRFAPFPANDAPPPVQLAVPQVYTYKPRRVEKTGEPSKIVTTEPPPPQPQATPQIDTYVPHCAEKTGENFANLQGVTSAFQTDPPPDTPSTIITASFEEISNYPIAVTINSADTEVNIVSNVRQVDLFTDVTTEVAVTSSLSISVPRATQPIALSISIGHERTEVFKTVDKCPDMWQCAINMSDMHNCMALLNRKYCSGVAPNWISSKVWSTYPKVDLSYVFTCLYIYQELYARLPENVDPIGNWDALGDGLRTFNGLLDPPVLTNLFHAINHDTLCLFYDELTPGMLSVAKVLSTGVKANPIPETHANIPTAALFRMPAIPILLLIGTFQSPENHHMAIPTAQDFTCFIQYLARLHECPGDMVRGFIMAARLLHGEHHTHPAVANDANAPACYVFYTSDFRTSLIRLVYPQPKPLVFLLANRKVNDDHTKKYGDDIWTITQMNYKQSRLVRGLIAAKASVGFSTVLHQYNLTGVELNQLVRGVPTTGCNVIRNLNNPYQFSTTPITFERYGLHVWATVGKGTFAVEPTPRDEFIVTTFQRPLMRVNTYYSHWPNDVPYMIEPLSLNFCLQNYNVCWGYMKPGSYMEIKNALSVNASHTDGYHARFAEGAYCAGGPTANIYIPYGGHMINILGQCLAIDGIVTRITEIPRWTRNNSNSYLERAADGRNAVRYIAGLRLLAAGSLRTYDYTTDTVISPVVPHTSFGDKWHYARRIDTFAHRFLSYICDPADYIPEEFPENCLEMTMAKQLWYR